MDLVLQFFNHFPRRQALKPAEANQFISRQLNIGSEEGLLWPARVEEEGRKGPFGRASAEGGRFGLGGRVVVGGGIAGLSGGRLGDVFQEALDLGYMEVSVG